MVICIFPFAHANKTQEFSHKMNVVQVNLETSIGMNGNIHLHHGRMMDE
jgi:hypothetical protein